VPLFELRPAQAHFKDVVMGESYEISVSIWNKEPHSMRIQVMQPHEPQLTVVSEKKHIINIAPGLSRNFNVILDVHGIKPEGLRDHVSLYLNQHEVKYPILVTFQEAVLQYERSLDFGFIRQGEERRLPLAFRNPGRVQGKVSLNLVDPLKVYRLAPKLFDVDCDSQQEVAITARPQGTKQVSARIEVRLNDVLQPDITLKSLGVEFSMFFINEQNQEIKELRFEDMLFGQEKTIHLCLVNNTPKDLLFKIGFREGDERQSRLQYSPEIIGRQEGKRVISCRPSKGTISYYQMKRIAIKCLAIPEEKDLVRVRKQFIDSSTRFEEKVFREFKYTMITSFFGE
jgi:hypothetical protein